MLSRQAGAVSSGLSVSGMMFSGVITGRLFNRCWLYQDGTYLNDFDR